MTVHCENTYDAQLSFQVLLWQRRIRSFKISGAAVDWLVILGRILYVCHQCLQLSFIHNRFVGWGLGATLDI